MSRAPATQAELRRGHRLGLALQAIREEQGLSQAELAQRSGVSVDTVRKIEQGRMPTPSVFAIASLASELRVKIEELVRRANVSK